VGNAARPGQDFAAWRDGHRGVLCHCCYSLFPGRSGTIGRFQKLLVSMFGAVPSLHPVRCGWFSLLGLVFAAGLLADYIRITWLVKGRLLLYYPIGAVLMAVLSVLPLLGLPEWWLRLGIRDQLVAVAVAIGIFTIIAGVWGHIFLVRTLPASLETNHEHAV
jgi:hypothetical protein